MNVAIHSRSSPPPPLAWTPITRAVHRCYSQFLVIPPSLFFVIHKPCYPNSSKEKEEKKENYSSSSSWHSPPLLTPLLTIGLCQALPRTYLTRVRNSSRVLGSSLKTPSMVEVVVFELIFWTPLITIHMWVPSTTTPTPVG